ncbi:McrB family protein [Methanotorris igneus]|uniref:ATPase associated with various cellular activities AAA_5 n=1 Tax=Methanotorris igneus (strain DSM 5666 / JCM 11834 / Kol 5) TaxID=880724 RepID=F6BF61_METIK|nr:AAA family ATPase [Methanotorris igneus]AEF96931.1 ATPase associated with various cellular activities AAA_5 [Methanotorris igneus Kol 5]
MIKAIVMEITNLEEIIKKYGNIDKNKVEEIKEILKSIKNELVEKLDELKNKKYDEGWRDIVGKATSICYIETGFPSNFSQALRDEPTREKLIEFIRNVKSAETKDDAYNAFKNLLSDKGTKSASITVVSTLGHILKPEWFIPLNHKISDAIEKLGLVNIHLAGAKGNYEDAINVFKKISENVRNIEDSIKTSYALYEYGEVPKPNNSKNSTSNNIISDSNTVPPEIKEKMDKILDKKRQIILYGVPGTGKTHSALKYVEGKGYYKFITFHQSYSYEDFIEGLKPKTTEDGNITYEVEDGIFKKMCILAIWEALKDKEDIKKEIDLDRLLDKALKEFEDKYPVGSVLKTKMGKKFKILDYKYKNEKISNILIKPNESVNEYYPLNIPFLKDMFEKDLIEGERINGPKDVNDKIRHTSYDSYYFALYKELKEIINNNIKDSQNEKLEYNPNYETIKEIVIEKLKEHKETKNVFKKEDFQNAQKFYLVIDEINRGNISNILGELITLLEKDKRLSEDNEIIVELPYSKEPFAVPPNLYIIGTMNTADRSIALLDIALRRRFGFLEVEPNYELIENNAKNKQIEGINLAELLKSLNEKLMKLKDRDHRIGHSYFLGVETLEDLEFVWYHEIIPLLEEYFYGDVDGLKEILKDFIEEKENSYEIKRLTGEEFKNAINKILSD